MRSPTSRVGYIEVEGIDLGSARDDLNKRLTLKAVKAALASSEHTFNNFDSQLLLESFKLSDVAADEAAAAETLLLSRTIPFFPPILCLLSVPATAVPPLSTKVLVWPILGWLQGSHLVACKKGIIVPGLMGEIPKAPIIQGGEEGEEGVVVAFIREIKPTIKGLCVCPPKTSAATVEYADEEEKRKRGVLGLGGLGRCRNSDE